MPRLSPWASAARWGGPHERSCLAGRGSALGVLQSQLASHTIERGGGSMSFAWRCSSWASNQPVSVLPAWLDRTRFGGHPA